MIGLLVLSKFRQISPVCFLIGFFVLVFISKDSQLIWSSWRKFSTVNLKSNELSDYIRKIFSKKFENSPKNEPWIIYGIQGVDTSYVRINVILI